MSEGMEIIAINDAPTVMITTSTASSPTSVWLKDTTATMMSCETTTMLCARTSSHCAAGSVRIHSTTPSPQEDRPHDGRGWRGVRQGARGRSRSEDAVERAVEDLIVCRLDLNLGA